MDPDAEGSFEAAIRPNTKALFIESLLASGIKPNTVRLSVGTEHIDDILYDLEQAFLE